MVYLGSKAKYSGQIVPILQNLIDSHNITTYIEPFVGGANIIDKIRCKTKVGYDKNYTLIALHQQAQKNFFLIPDHGNREWWDESKGIYRMTKGEPEEIDKSPLPAWSIGAIAFFGSFSNGGFTRGYAKNSSSRDFYNEAWRNMAAQSKEPLYQDVEFRWIDDYSHIEIPKGSLIYSDPPYQGTKAYGYSFETNFNYDSYWDWVRELSKDNIVICSEQAFPDDCRIIWQQNVKRTNGADNNYKAIEKLGTFNNI